MSANATKTESSADKNAAAMKKAEKIDVNTAVVYNKNRGYAKKTWKTIQGVIDTDTDGLPGKLTAKAAAVWQAKKGLTVDGMVGKNTYKAVMNVAGDPAPEKSEKPAEEHALGLLSQAEVKECIAWTNRKSTSLVKKIQKVVGVPETGVASAEMIQAIAKWQSDNGLKADGYFGPKSQAKAGIVEEVPAQEIDNSPIPKQSVVRNNQSCYGKPGTNLTSVSLPYTMYYGKTPVNSIYCHSKITNRVVNIFKQTLEYYGLDGIQKNGLDRYSGCYNDRNISGGKAKSMHAWGIAIDLDAANNPDRVDKNHTDRLAQPEASKFWDIVEANGGYSLGRHANRDWMHFQFASWG